VAVSLLPGDSVTEDLSSETVHEPDGPLAVKSKVLSLQLLWSLFVIVTVYVLVSPAEAFWDVGLIVTCGLVPHVAGVTQDPLLQDFP
jgi:hypothetical protein